MKLSNDDLTVVEIAQLNHIIEQMEFFNDHSSDKLLEEFLREIEKIHAKGHLRLASRV